MSWKSALFLLAAASLFPVKGEAVCTDPANAWTGATGNQRWNNAGNWSVCIPGVLITDEDLANFGPVGSGTISLDAAGGDLAISPGLNSLTFNNVTGFTISSAGAVNHIQFNSAGLTQPSLQVLAGNHTMNAVMTINSTTLNMTVSNASQLTIQQNLNDISPGSLTFTGPGTLLVAPPVANRGISVGGSFTQISGTVQLSNTNAVAALTGSKISAATGLFINGGSYVSINSAPISFTGTGASNESPGVSGRMVLTNGAISIQNTGMITISGRGSAFTIGDLGIAINGGSIDALNSGPLNSAAGAGCLLTSTGTITVNGGAITSTNTATVTASATARGCNFIAGTDLTINSGTFTQTNTSSGTINGVDALGCSLSSIGNTILNGGTITNINNGTITAGTGARFFGNANLTINNGSVLSTNSGTTNSTTAFGSFLASNFNVNINGGTVTSINSGTINAGAGSRIFGDASINVSGGVLTLDNSGTVNAGSGTAGVQAVGTRIQISGGTTTLSNSGAVLNSATNSVGTQMRANTNLTMSGGTLTITANTGAVSGTNNSGSRVEAVGNFTLNGGTLLNDDTVQTPILTIGSLGNMAGKGSFSDLNSAQTTQIINSGTVTPGNPGPGAVGPGVMSINGSYTQSSSGKLITNILNPSTFSRLSILGSTSGTAQLDGNLEVALSPGASFAPGDVFSIVTTEQANGVSGTFANIINDAPGLVPHIQYFPNHVDLFFTPGLTNFIGGFSEVMLASVNQINVSLGRQLMRLHDRLPRKRRQTELSRGPSDLQLIAANDLDFSYCNPCIEELPWNLYFGPTGNVGKVFNNGTQPGFTYWSAGATAGFDYAFDQVGVGLRLDYDHIDGHSRQWGDFFVNEAHASVYSTYVPLCIPELAVNGIVGGSYEWYQFSRKVFMSSNRAIGTPNGGEFDALFDMEYTLSNRQIAKMPECLTIVPLVNLQYIYLNVNQYTERNAGLFNLQMRSQTVQSLRSTLGSRFHYIWIKENTVITTEIDFAWQREYLNHSRNLSFAPLAFVQPFSAVIVPASGRNIILAGIDLMATYQEKYGWEASYDFEWNSKYLNHNFYLGFNVNF